MKDEELLKEAHQRYTMARDYWHDNRKNAKDDMEFLNGNHWPENVKNVRKDRPCLVVDKISQYVRQIVNDGRQNRPAVKVRPIDDNGDEEIADVFEGLIRHIWDDSKADDMTDTALEHAATGGFGWGRVITEYEHERTFNQVIKVKRIRNPLSVLVDPFFSEADASDMRFGFIDDTLPKETFNKQYPKAQKVNWENDNNAYHEGWLTDHEVKVVEYFYIEEESLAIHLLEDGTTVTDEEYRAAQAAGIQAPQIVDTRSMPQKSVKWCRLSGAEILEKSDWLGKYIPIVPIFGDESDIDGKVYYKGIVRQAKDAQRLYNYSRSAFAERVALTPKSPYIAPAGAVDDYYNEWSSANTENHAVLRYNHTDEQGNPIPPPTRQSAVDIPAGFAQDMQISEHDIQAAIGMYNASIGEKSNEKSGRAILAKERQGDTSTFHYHDNVNRAIRQFGRILIDMIPKIYDSRRVVRIVGLDGSTDTVQVNPEQETGVAKMGEKSIFNLNVGTYDVTVTAGPSYNTKRMEAADAMMSFSQQDPNFMPRYGDIVFRQMDWPGAEEIAKRAKLFLPPEIAQAEQQDGASPEVKQVMTQAQQAIQQRDAALHEATQQIHDLFSQVNELQHKLQSKAGDLTIREHQANTQAFEAETKRIAAVIKAMSPEQLQSITGLTTQQAQTPADL